jgi:hypothetical protein
MNLIMRAAYQRQMLQTGYAGHFYNTPLTNTKIINAPRVNMLGQPRANLSGLPRQSFANQIAEQLDDLAVKTLTPSLFPAFKQIENLQESPNISQGTRDLLKLIELGIIGLSLYAGYKLLSN